MNAPSLAVNELNDDQLGSLRSTVFRFVRRRTGDVHAAQDVTQEALLRCVRSDSKPKNARAFVKRVARNLLFNARRDRREEVVLESGIAAGSRHEPPRQMATAERSRQVRLSLDSLGFDDREIVRLRHEQALPFAVIAERLGYSEAATRKRYTRALGRLRVAVDTDR